MAQDAPPPPSPLLVNGGVIAGLLVKQVRPVYPAEARKNRVQGSVRVEIRVGENGKVEEAKLMDGNPLLAQAAVDAVKQWEYKPYLLNGIPTVIGSWAVVNFILQ